MAAPALRLINDLLPQFFECSLVSVDEKKMEAGIGPGAPPFFLPKRVVVWCCINELRRLLMVAVNENDSHRLLDKVMTTSSMADVPGTSFVMLGDDVGRQQRFGGT